MPIGPTFPSHFSLLGLIALLDQPHCGLAGPRFQTPTKTQIARLDLSLSSPEMQLNVTLAMNSIATYRVKTVIEFRNWAATWPLGIVAPLLASRHAATAWPQAVQPCPAPGENRQQDNTEACDTNRRPSNDGTSNGSRCRVGMRLAITVGCDRLHHTNHDLVGKVTR